MNYLLQQSSILYSPTIKNLSSNTKNISPVLAINGLFVHTITKLNIPQKIHSNPNSNRTKNEKELMC